MKHCLHSRASSNFAERNLDPTCTPMPISSSHRVSIAHCAQAHAFARKRIRAQTHSRANASALL
eukprot:2530987-Pleurochrysis_carterae.AAC.1